ncbi:hypothetical protein [Psychromicrobium sp. YIM B11713]|uniref:hypothetical protein n=1 Tax=Psychromicrobium sp. YIM B11713 TaxID=3145233 RepID=UPI00374EE3A9
MATTGAADLAKAVRLTVAAVSGPLLVQPTTLPAAAEHLAKIGELKTESAERPVKAATVVVRVAAATIEMTKTKMVSQEKRKAETAAVSSVLVTDSRPGKALGQTGLGRIETARIAIDQTALALLNQGSTAPEPTDQDPNGPARINREATGLVLLNVPIELPEANAALPGKTVRIVQSASNARIGQATRPALSAATAQNVSNALTVRRPEAVPSASSPRTVTRMVTAGSTPGARLALPKAVNVGSAVNGRTLPLRFTTRGICAARTALTVSVRQTLRKA